jgi:SAM-dependent methyltransferase
MENGETDSQLLIERLRSEVRRRKLLLVQQPVVHPPSTENAPPPKFKSEAKPRLKYVQRAVDRAAAKSEVSGKWPRFLRRIRRNQEAVNEAVISALQKLLETNTWMREKTAIVDLRIADQSNKTEEYQARLADVDRKLQELCHQAAAQENATQMQLVGLTELRQDFAQHAQRAAEQENRFAKMVEKIEEGHTRPEQRNQDHARELLDLSSKLSGIEETLAQNAKQSLSDDLKRHETDAFYLAFENQFRGSREEIKDRLGVYLPFVKMAKARTKNSSVVDVGCGRGEWLELLSKNKYDARGVDMNGSMVEECRSRGVAVECMDGVAYLKNLSSASIAAVTGFHIVEHLSFNQMYELFREAFRVLREGGLAIFETPNPECLKVTNYNFFLDPTHRNPIPQELLSFVATQAGFGKIQIERLHPYYEKEVFKGHGDYAGIFEK